MERAAFAAAITWSGATRILRAVEREALEPEDRVLCRGDERKLAIAQHLADRSVPEDGMSRPVLHLHARSRRRTTCRPPRRRRRSRSSGGGPTTSRSAGSA